MSKRVILHVGLPKTGTTAFQESLELNRDQIPAQIISFSTKAEVGMAFCKRVRDIVRHGSNRWRLWQLDRAARGIRAWVDRQPHDVVLVTEENLLGWRVRDMYRMSFENGPRQAMEALVRALDGYELHWVLYRRDAKAHMRSAYRYFVKLRGVSDGCEEWSRRIGTPEVLDQLVEDTARAFGDAGHVFDMEAEKATAHAWGAPILRLAGMSEDKINALTPAPRTNIGLPGDLLDYVRDINAIGLNKAERLKAVDVVLRLHADLSGGTPREAYGRVK
ncbi:hypothetical protein PGB28_02275 [Primorskyibacter aestuariivivens]|uniref:hypothetical protein n=1 Tax=Primorskyibacter aestuariivivens TaxID=1888912 RepID=UPI0023010C6C|nr:hypothetical protein [Primorskyibacter aestuariivivens]MDA7427268.1 hypothetical protein [Primorskyibacter aestuariivivens]